MDNITIMEIIVTVVNLCLTSISVFCAVFSTRQTKKQTDLINPIAS